MATSEATITDNSGVCTRTTYFQGGGSSVTTIGGNRVLYRQLSRANQVRGKVPGYNLWKGTGFGLDKALIEGLHGQFKFFRQSPWSSYTDSGYLAGLYGQASASAATVWSPQTKDAMQAKCELDMLNGFKSGPNLAQMYAERKQVEKLALSFLSTTISVIRDIKRKDFKRAYKRLTGDTRQTANLQLVMQYGVKPLASDVYDSVNRILAESPLPLITSKGSARESWAYREDVVVGQTVSIRRHQKEAGWRSTIVAELTDPELAIAESAGLTNPVALAWELMPYSFVLDWIAPIGPALTAMTATNGFKFVTGSRTFRAEHSVVETAVGIGNLSGSAAGSAYSKAISRAAYNGFPFVFPVVNFHYTPTRFFNTLALGWQRWMS